MTSSRPRARAISGTAAPTFVTGPGHCGACHTPKNFLSGDEYDKALQGGLLDNWLAPNLNGDAHGGLAAWSEADIVEFLKTGRNAKASAGASMTLVIQHSTSNMGEQDLGAIATYIKSLPAALPPPSPSSLDPRAMAAGAAIYRDACAACHRADGQGVSQAFPSLAGDALLQSRDPTTINRYILSGTPTATTPAKPTPLAMPAFAWKLSDQQIADVATYIRNSWGNIAPPVSPGQVAGLRRKSPLRRSGRRPARREFRGCGRHLLLRGGQRAGTAGGAGALAFEGRQRRVRRGPMTPRQNDPEMEADAVRNRQMKTPEQARQAVKTGHVRWMLVASLALGVIALGGAYAWYASLQSQTPAPSPSAAVTYHQPSG